jgi:hypothetical protein
VSYLPLIEESAFCAPCHFGVFWDTVIYNSYGEWLDSPYSDPNSGRTCQDCHMPPAGYDAFVYPEKGGLYRDPNRISSHLMPGAADDVFLQNTATVVLSAERENGVVNVRTTVTNTEAGHHIPTDSPLRQIFLVVTAMDAEGNPLALQSGPTLPKWAGDLSGEAGIYFALILEELWTRMKPTGNYWMPTRVVEDTRLPALAQNVSAYTFVASADTSVTIEARLIFRRAFYELMQQKDWDIPDILMEHEAVSLPCAMY